MAHTITWERLPARRPVPILQAAAGSMDGDNMTTENTYWNHKGKYQEWTDKLSGLIPDKGRAKALHIDLLRNLDNCYHDHYNNGNCNWYDSKELQFEHVAYYADELTEAAKAEGVDDIEALLASIRKVFDDAAEDNLFYPVELGPEFDALGEKWEKLADIITRYAWEVEQVAR